MFLAEILDDGLRIELGELRLSIVPLCQAPPPKTCKSSK